MRVYGDFAKDMRRGLSCSDFKKGKHAVVTRRLYVNILSAVLSDSDDALVSVACDDCTLYDMDTVRAYGSRLIGDDPKVPDRPSLKHCLVCFGSRGWNP